MNALGNAVHACMAISFSDLGKALSLEEVERILSAHGVADCVVAANLLRQVAALHDWISLRWPKAVAMAEHPVQCVLDTGRVLNGRIDLLLDNGDGWVLIDHKSTQQSAEHWEHLANDYGAQLMAYGEAIRLATGREVREFWLFLPVAGGAVRLDAATTRG